MNNANHKSCNKCHLNHEKILKFCRNAAIPLLRIICDPTEKDGLQEIQNKAIEIAFFAVLTVLSDSILGDVLIHS